MFYILCIMSFIWRTSAQSTENPPNLSSSGLLIIRIVLSSVLGMGIVYGGLVLRTFARYGDTMDNTWKTRIDDWMDLEAARREQSVYGPHSPSRLSHPKDSMVFSDPSETPYSKKHSQLSPSLRTSSHPSPNTYYSPAASEMGGSPIIEDTDSDISARTINNTKQNIQLTLPQSQDGGQKSGTTTHPLDSHNSGTKLSPLSGMHLPNFPVDNPPPSPIYHSPLIDSGTEHIPRSGADAPKPRKILRFADPDNEQLLTSRQSSPTKFPDPGPHISPQKDNVEEDYKPVSYGQI